MPGSGLAARGGGKATVTRYPLRIPPTVSLADLSRTGLAAAPGVADLGGGNTSSVLAYNGFFPGPTIRASRGDSASIHFVNGLADETTVHWHGMIVPTAADGQPQNAVACRAQELDPPSFPSVRACETLPVRSRTEGGSA